MQVIIDYHVNDFDLLPYSIFLCVFIMPAWKKLMFLIFFYSLAVKRVLGKLPILFNGVQIGVEEFRPDVRVEDYSEEAGEDSENILEVRGVSSKTSEDTVMMYFENTRRSGGGEIKSMKSEDDGVFYIIFEDDQGNCTFLKCLYACRYVTHSQFSTD